ncbi:unnamed protein product, partial [Heterosigma akashiwo]
KAAVLRLALYAVYLVIFSLSVVLNSGRNSTHGYHLTRGLEAPLAEDGDLPFADLRSPEDYWGWLEGPVLETLFFGPRAAWYAGRNLTGPAGATAAAAAGPAPVHAHAVLLGGARLSQWRTRPDSCSVSAPLLKAWEVDYCFADSAGVSANELREPFGPDLQYQFQEKVHKKIVYGEFARYGRGSFTEMLGPAPADANATLAQLRANSWLDAATRAALLEFAVYSAPLGKLSYAAFLAEFSGEGALPVCRHTVNTFDSRGLIFSLSSRTVYANTLVDLALLCALAALAAGELRRLRRAGAGVYCLEFFNNLQWFIFALHLAIFVVINPLTYIELQRINSKADKQEYMDIRGLSSLVVAQQLMVGTTLLLAWLKLFDPVQAVFKDFFLLVKMVTLMVQKLCRSYAPLLGVLYAGWALARYALLSQIEFGARTLQASLTTQYPESLGEFNFDAIQGDYLYQNWRYPLMVVFTLVVVVVMLNLLVSMLNDLYEDLK